jgi:Protein of unknown function (DUF4054)
MFSAPAFRGQFVQFADAIAFPDVTLQANYDMATGYVSPDQFGDMTAAVRTHALGLMTAHLLALGALIASGRATRVVTGSSVGDVSVTLQPPPAPSQWRWWLNCTPYGAQLVSLLSAQAVGGFYVGGLPERAAFRKVGGYFG